MAKYHLGKVKLERVGHRPSPTPLCNLRGGLIELQGSLCALLLVLCCIVALFADHSRSIFAYLQIIADSAFWASPTPMFIFVDDFNTNNCNIFKEVLTV